MTISGPGRDSILSLQALFETNVLYKCPLFQRQYAWNQRQIDDLWTDIGALLDESSESVFMGALILQTTSDTFPSARIEYLIVDGQQRITTLYLLLFAIALVADEQQFDDLHSDVVPLILGNRSDSRNKPKIQPTVPDLAEFSAIMRNLRRPAPVTPVPSGRASSESLLTEAFKRMREEVTRRGTFGGELDQESLRHIFNKIVARLEFVPILLRPQHQAAEVFDRLNRRGTQLRLVDLVRNEVFRRFSARLEEADATYRSIWQPFEEEFPDSASLDGYFFPYALIRRSSATVASAFGLLSDYWRQVVGDQASNNPAAYAQGVVGDLKEFVPAYLAFSKQKRPESCPEDLWNAALPLARMPAPSVTYPYLLQLLNAGIEGRVSPEYGAKALRTVESFLVRRAFQGLEPTGLHAVFKRLWEASDPSSESIPRLIDSLETSTISFPDDDEFKKQIRSGDLYHRKLSKFVLAEYERMYGRGDRVPESAFDDATIDHVLPQKPGPGWKSIFSEAQRESLTHTWANLVLLTERANSTKNSKDWPNARRLLSNETIFASTKHLYDDFEKWTPKSIAKRADKLTAWAVKRWPRTA